MALRGLELADGRRPAREGGGGEHAKDGPAQLVGERHVTLQLAICRGPLAAQQVRAERDLRGHLGERAVAELLGQQVGLGGDRQALVDAVGSEGRPVARTDGIGEGLRFARALRERPGFTRQRVSHRHRQGVGRRAGESRQDT